MEIQPKKPTAEGPADWFTGNVWIDPITQGQGQIPLSLGSVHFTPGPRTAWHGHTVSQTFYVTEGEGCVQSPVPSCGRWGSNPHGLAASGV